MPYLHWATTGDGFNHQNAVINKVTERCRDSNYTRPTPEDIEAEGETNITTKLIRAFLIPRNDRCLHIRKTLHQYYYSTSTVDDERTVNQIVYKFATKQHRRKLLEAERAQREIDIWKRGRADRMKWEALETMISEKAEPSSHSRRSCEATREDQEVMVMDRHEPPWDPPKVIIVDQLWMWIIDGSRFRNGLIHEFILIF